MRQRKTLLRDIEPFMEFFSLEQWTMEKLMGPELNNCLYCKICDKYVTRSLCDDHFAWHLKERLAILKKRKKDAQKKREESLRLAREARAQ